MPQVLSTKTHAPQDSDTRFIVYHKNGKMLVCMGTTTSYLDKFPSGFVFQDPHTFRAFRPDDITDFAGLCLHDLLKRGFFTFKPIKHFLSNTPYLAELPNNNFEILYFDDIQRVWLDWAGELYLAKEIVAIAEIGGFLLKPKLLEPIKLKVTPKESEHIQQLVFAKGGGWGNDKTTVIGYASPYLYIDKALALSYGTDSHDSTLFFNNWLSKQVTATEAIDLLNTLPNVNGVIR